MIQGAPPGGAADNTISSASEGGGGAGSRRLPRPGFSFAPHKQPSGWAGGSADRIQTKLPSAAPNGWQQHQQQPGQHHHQQLQQQKGQQLGLATQISVAGSTLAGSSLPAQAPDSTVRRLQFSPLAGEPPGAPISPPVAIPTRQLQAGDATHQHSPANGPHINPHPAENGQQHQQEALAWLRPPLPPPPPQQVQNGRQIGSAQMAGSVSGPSTSLPALSPPASQYGSFNSMASNSLAGSLAGGLQGRLLGMPAATGLAGHWLREAAPAAAASSDGGSTRPDERAQAAAVDALLKLSPLQAAARERTLELQVGAAPSSIPCPACRNNLSALSQRLSLLCNRP